MNKRYAKNNFECIIVYGRRRVGKTTLINEFCKDKPIVFFSALNASSRENLETLSEEFKVVMKNRLFAETMPVTDALLKFCSTPRSRAEIVSFVGKSKNHVMSQIVVPLVTNGKLKMTMPEKPKSSNQKFVKV